MEDNKQPIPYSIEDELIQGTYYKSECGINFTYDEIGNREKPYLLDNTYRLNHLPTSKDIPTNNLQPLSLRDKEERKKIASAGGKRSQEVQRNRRTFRESMEMVLSIKASDEDISNLPNEVKQYIKSNGIELTLEDLINIKSTLLAIDGSVQHAVFSRDTVGEKPTDKQEITAEVFTEADKKLLEKVSNRLDS